MRSLANFVESEGTLVVVYQESLFRRRHEWL